MRILYVKDTVFSYEVKCKIVKENKIYKRIIRLEEEDTKNSFTIFISMNFKVAIR